MNVAQPTHVAASDQDGPASARHAAPQRLAVRGRHRDTARSVTALTDILAGQLPGGLPARPRDLAGRLRDDDQLARRVWSHPTFAALVDWAARYHPRSRNVWEEMAVYALARGRAYQAGRVTAAEVRTGMLNTARWVSHRGRHGERLDRSEFVLLLDFDTVELDVAESHFDDAATGLCHTLDPPAYLSACLRRSLPAATSEVVTATWRIARGHYEWLIEVSGLTGKALVSEAQARSSVNRSRRLVNRLPFDWPAATRKAAGLLFTGSPSSGDGLLVWWATTPPEAVPAEVRVRWNGLLAVVNPEVGCLTETTRRGHRDRAREWTAAIPVTLRGIAL